MWQVIGRILLRQRLAILLLTLVITAWFGWLASKNEIRYDFAKLLPTDDTTFIEYSKFKKTFGEDGNVFVIGVTDPKLFQLDHFLKWYDLSQTLKNLKGVEGVVSVASVFNLHRNDSLKKFEFKPIITHRPRSPAELDSLKNQIFSLPFYRDILYNPGTQSYMMAVTMDRKLLDSKGRNDFILQVQKIGDSFSKSVGLEVHYSGLPYIRTVLSVLVQRELRVFMILASLALALIMYFFFRSFSVVFYSMLTVGIGVVWCMGLNVLFGYKLSVLTAIVPTLLIVLGVPNCVFILNKYHFEFKSHGNKIKALMRVIQKVGNSTFLTNATTAAGFVTFAFTESQVILEFGVISTIAIMILYVHSITLMPIILSYLPAPSTKDTNHLDSKYTNTIVDLISYIIHYHRNLIYITSFILVGFGGFYISKIKTTGNIVDDLPQDHPVLSDLHYFEENYHGVMPFEISVDTKKKRGVMNPSVFRKLEKLQDVLSEYKEFARPLSVNEVLKFSKQGFYYGDSTKYSLPSSQEQVFILQYVQVGKQKQNMLKSFIDSNRQITRVSAHMKDIGTLELHRIKTELRPKIDSIFNPKKYEVTMTGTSIVFLKGTDYLINDLYSSLFWALVLTALLMAGMFSNLQMVFVCLVPNLIPLVLTAAIMGVAGIAIKPSTILVFSIAFGIAVDNTIHFLAKYRQELKNHDWNIKTAVNAALKEASIGIIYTSVVLFCGFGIFSFSTFGGTKALGVLTSFTLVVAMFSNLFILPSMLLSIDKANTRKTFEDPWLRYYDEEEDVDLEKLDIQKDS